MTEALSATLRRLVRRDMTRRPRTMRATAELAGLTHTVLWRWLRGGSMAGGGIDLLVAYLGEREVAAAIAEGAV